MIKMLFKIQRSNRNITIYNKALSDNCIFFKGYSENLHTLLFFKQSVQVNTSYFNDYKRYYNIEMNSKVCYD